MRKITFALGLLMGAASFGGAAHADPYKWCAEYSGGRGGSTNCYFITHQQCQAALAGGADFCRPNPFYTGRMSSRDDRRHAE
jgi:hypothetical protein